MLTPEYCIYLNKRPGRLFHFGTLRVRGHLFEHGRFLFFQHFLQMRTFLENNKTKNIKQVCFASTKQK